MRAWLRELWSALRLILRQKLECAEHGHDWEPWRRKPRRFLRSCPRCHALQWVFDDGRTLP